MGKNTTVYINNENEEQFFKEEKPNALINGLLSKHYEDMKTSKKIREIIENDHIVPGNKMVPEQIHITEYDGEKSCCIKDAPCAHWTWDESQMVWLNILSGRKREDG